MKILISVLSLFLAFVSLPVFCENKDHIKFMLPMIPFQVCVLNTSQNMFTNKAFVKLHSKLDGALEEEVWQEVLSKCKEHAFSDKTHGLILLAYNGNNEKTLGYLEGAIYAARNYILIKGSEYKNNKP